MANDGIRSITVIASPEMEHIAKDVYEELVRTEHRATFQVVQYTQFANKEIKPKIAETVRDTVVYFFHSLYYPEPNESIIRMMLVCDALRGGSAKGIRLIIPYIPYQRQDRKDESRVPISARVFWEFMQTNRCITHAITMDMHSDQLQGFTDIPVDNFPGRRVLAKQFRDIYKEDLSSLLVVSPDIGSSVRSERFANMLFAGNLPLGQTPPMSIIQKHRPAANVVEVVNIIGPSVLGKDVVMYDDMIDTGGSIIEAAKALRDLGAKDIYTVATHGIFSGRAGKTAEQKLRDSGMQIIITDSIPRDRSYCEANKDWLTVISIKETLAKIIIESFPGGSVSALY